MWKAPVSGLGHPLQNTRPVLHEAKDWFFPCLAQMIQRTCLEIKWGAVVAPFTVNTTQFPQKGQYSSIQKTKLKRKRSVFYKGKHQKFLRDWKHYLSWSVTHSSCCLANNCSFRPFWGKMLWIQSLLHWPGKAKAKQILKKSVRIKGFPHNSCTFTQWQDAFG